MCAIPLLPPEVILIILDQLNFRERLALATVCKQWHNLVFDTRFCQRMVLRVNYKSNLRELKHSLPLQRCRRVQVECYGLSEEIGTLLVDSPVEQLIVTGRDLEIKALLERNLPSMGRIRNLEIRFQFESSCPIMTLANSNLKSLTLRGTWRSVPTIDVKFPALKAISVQQDDGSSRMIPVSFGQHKNTVRLSVVKGNPLSDELTVLI